MQLETVLEVNPENEQVGHVISSLMHVGDILSLAPATIGSLDEGKLRVQRFYFCQHALILGSVVLHQDK